MLLIEWIVMKFHPVSFNATYPSRTKQKIVRKTHIITLLFVNVCHNIRLLCMSPQFKKKILKKKNSSVLIKYPYYHSKASFEPEKNNKTKYVPHSIVTILSKFFVCLWYILLTCSSCMWYYTTYITSSWKLERKIIRKFYAKCKNKTKN